MDQIDGLISVLLDRSAREDERDDAAMDLGDYDDNRALHALIAIALNHNEDPLILPSCGEAIARIWVQRNYFNKELYNQLSRPAKLEVYTHISGWKPEWIEKYNIPDECY